mgnify:CR=1 FL=1
MWPCATPATRHGMCCPGARGRPQLADGQNGLILSQRSFAHRHFRNDSVSGSAHAAGTGHTTSDESISHRANLIRSLNCLIDSLEEMLLSRSMLPGPKGRPPRLVQLGQALELTVKETKALQFVLLSCVGYKGTCSSHSAMCWAADTQPRDAPLGVCGGLAGSHDYEERGQIRNMMEYAGMTGKELLEFLTPGKPVLAQGMIELNDDYATV